MCGIIAAEEELMRIRLKDWRQRRLLTQAELAERVGMTVGTINRIERAVHEPRFSTIRKLAVALGVTPEDMIVDEPSDQLDSRHDRVWVEGRDRRGLE
jgi:transcriptional regulator with XRE-family HTH domain